MAAKKKKKKKRPVSRGPLEPPTKTDPSAMAQQGGDAGRQASLERHKKKKREAAAKKAAAAKAKKAAEQKAAKEAADAKAKKAADSKKKPAAKKTPSPRSGTGLRNPFSGSTKFPTANLGVLDDRPVQGPKKKTIRDSLTKRRRMRDLPKDTLKALKKTPAAVKPVAKAVPFAQTAMQLYKVGDLATSEEARREALRKYGSEAEFFGKKAADEEILSGRNIARSAVAGVLNPAESAFASFKAAQLMSQDPAGDLLKSAAESGKSKAEIQSESFARATKKLARLRGDAIRDKYTSKMDPQFRPSGDDDELFAGRVGDLEFAAAEQDEFSTAPKTYAALVESRRSDDEAIKERAMARERKAAEVQGRKPRSWEELKKIPQIASKSGKISFDENDRRAFLQAAQSGQLLEMFDADGDGKLSREERGKFFLSNDEGFRSKAQSAGIYADAMPPTDPEEAPLGIDPNTGDPIMPEYTLPPPPPPPVDVDELAEKGLEGAPPIQYEPENIVEETREERPKTEAEKRRDLIAEGRKLGLRTQDFGSFGGFKVATDIAAGRRPASGVTALTGSVGRLGDAPRRLGTKAGRYRREARRLEREGYRTEAGKLRGAAAALSVNEPNVKSQADILEEQRRARENAEIAEDQRRQALAAARKREEERRKKEQEALVTAGEQSINSD